MYNAWHHNSLLLCLTTFTTDEIFFYFKAPKSGKEQGDLPLLSDIFKVFRKGKKFENPTDGLKRCYKEILKPAEEASLFTDFHGSKIDEVAEFDAVPYVMVSLCRLELLY